ncbi:vancomycin resistance protein YoaR [Micromonospora pisi]|uniref:Vancomycin resistance protein YoaR n=1 Tax=Micromonospora pisi TaxID=589240 RepID=A0A495JK83_9ACTN|nr:VanW family protein [Micromonospora pisi]RKR89470.1 vancomycin resistance protein YoaR [Micromonospora pisi]
MSLYGAKRPPAGETPTTELAAVPRQVNVPPTGPATPPPIAAGPVGHPPVPPLAGAPGAQDNPTETLDSTAPADPALLTEPAPRRGVRRALAATGVVAAVLAVIGGSAGYAYSGEVPRGTEVLGVNVGGQSREGAAALLRAELERRAETFAAPVQVRIGEQSAELKPIDVGLAVDVTATITAAVDDAPGPVDLLFRSRSIEPVITVDAERLDAELRKTVGRGGRPMTPPSIVFQGTTPKPNYPAPGQDLNPEQSAEAVRTGWLSGQPVVVPVIEAHPTTTREEVDKLVEELAKPAVSAPVTVTTERGSFTVPPAAIAKSLLLHPDKAGKINPAVDEKKLHAALTGELAKVELKPKEATVTLQGGKPQVVASTGGHGVDIAALSRDLLPVLAKRDGREVKGVLKPIEPKTNTEAMSKMGIKEQVSTFTTKFTGGLSLPRNHNIMTIAKEVDGAVVKPGETFSLNKHTGERSYAQGYKDAPVILDGKLVPGVGGGASQFTTTIFNATYYAGLEDVEHKPHSYWFERYPAVIESTIFYPTLDLKFRNNTEYGVLVDTSWTNDSVTVSIWSTKVYDSVKTVYTPRRDITKPKVVYLDPGPSCIATAGIDGFTQDAYRVITKGGKELKREKFSWRYEAEPRYLCAKKPG